MRIGPFLPSLCALGMAIIFIALGFNAKWHNSKLEKEGASFTGHITKSEVQKGSKGKKRYIVWVTWGEGDQIKKDDSFVVTPSFFESRLGSKEKADGDMVTIRAIPGKPESAVVVGGTSDLSGMERLGYFVAAIGGLLLLRVSRGVVRQRA